MANLRKRLNGFIFIFVFFPLCLLLVVINNQLWGNLNRGQNMRSNLALDRLVSAVERTLDAELAALQAHTRDEQIAKVLELTRRPSGEGVAGWTVEKWFEEVVKMERGTPRISEEDAARRAAQYNPLTTKLNALCGGSPVLVNALITDILGDVIAASYPPEETNVKGESWWRETVRKPFGEFAIEGPDENQRIWVNVPVWRNGENTLPLGVMQFEVDLKSLIKRTEGEALAENQAGLVVGNEAWYGLGSDEVLSRHGQKIFNHVQEHFSDRGYLGGVRFNRRFIKDGYGFKPNLRVIILMQESLIVGAGKTRLAVSGLLSLGLLAAVTMLARRTGRSISVAQEELESAGQVLLHRIRAPEQAVVDNSGGRKSASAKKLEEELNAWLSNYRQSALDNVVSHEFEMQRDLELAKEFQMAYLNRPYPKVPRVHVAGRMRLKFAHRYSPALVLGGDFFDVVSLEHDCAGIYVADVMGHGTRSALITSILRTLISELAGSKGRNARSFMAEINKEFCELLNSVKMPHPLFASAYYFVADTTARAATYSTAGHPAPYHLKRKGNKLERLEVTAPHGSALGINPKEEFTGGGCRLNPGDAFIFFTDGVYEAFNANGQEFGLQNIEKVIRSKMHDGIDSILDGIIQAVDQFTGHEPLRDDICLVGIEVTEEAE